VAAANLRFETTPTHSALHDHLELRWRHQARWGWFLRAETFYGLASHVTGDDDPRTGLAALFGDLHGESHGESFLDIATSRFGGAGFYLLDEPEAALSVHGQLKLLRIIFDSCREGSQFVIATHSPLLLALPGAVCAELGDDGIAMVDYDDLDVVRLWRQFLDRPDAFFRHLLTDDDEN
jgi:predicted ATPase